MPIDFIKPLRANADALIGRWSDWLTLTLGEQPALARLASLPPPYRRAAAAGVVGLLHLGLIYLLLAGLGQTIIQPAERELFLTFNGGGPRVARSEIVKPPIVLPQEPVVTPPEIEIADDPANAIAVAPAAGGPGVTVPAEAIGTSHTVPVLPASLLTIARQAMLRLRLMVGTDGTITDASVDTSTGSQELDRLVVAWVKAHWRYRPAMRDGVAISVTTTALVPFS